VLARKSGFFLCEHDLDLRWMDLSCRCIERVGARHHGGSIDHELALADNVHELDASEHIGGSAKRLEAKRHVVTRVTA
jgi:hypothetical protein